MYKNDKKTKRVLGLLLALVMALALIPMAIATVEDADYPLEDIIAEYPAEPGDYDYDDDTYYIEDEYAHAYPEYEALGELNPIPGYIDIVPFNTPVSTAAELRAAIALGGTQVIELANDIVDSLPIPFIPPGVNITLTSGPGGPFSLVRAASTRHFAVDGGTLTLENVTIDGGGSNSHGGGIWTDFRPQQTTTGPNVIFYRNEARRAVVPPEPPLPNIQFTRSSIIGDYGEFIHLLNNYDINYFLHDVNPNRVLMNLVELIYDANGGTGGPLRVGHPVNAWVRADSVHTVLTCLAANITAPPGYGLAGWSTVYDGSGRFYDVGSEINLADNIPINGNITLFAQWARWTVTFNLNGGTYMEAAIKRFCYKQCPMDKTQLR